MRRIALALLATLLLPTAAAHTTAPTGDRLHCITVGNLGEPVTTFAKTGLDLIVRESRGAGTCAGDDRGAEVDGAHLTLTAVLVSPAGDELAGDLVKQFGTTGRYTFDEPYYLSQPGQYVLRLSGTIEGPNGTSAVDGDYNVAGELPAQEDLFFPDELDTQLALQERVAALEAENERLRQELDQLDADMAALKSDHDAEDDRKTPGVTIPLLLAGLTLIVFALRRR